MTPYPAVFLALIDPIIGLEGGYSNDAGDSGGETMWGITWRTARAFGYIGDMVDMTRDEAVAIYFARYWTAPGFDQLARIDTPIAGKLLDIGINSGPSLGGRFLQRALNVLNTRGNVTLYASIGVDGSVGALTRDALQAFIRIRGDDGRRVLLGMILAQQSVRYIELAETIAPDRNFEFGWQRARAVGAIMGVAV